MSFGSTLFKHLDKKYQYLGISENEIDYVSEITVFDTEIETGWSPL